MLIGSCPVGKAVADVTHQGVIIDSVYQFNPNYRGIAECSNQGSCNRVTGACQCNAPFTGAVCNLRMLYFIFLLLYE